jgi:hypothetical protein
MYDYELVLPDSTADSRYGREKSLGPAEVGLRIKHLDVAADGSLTLPMIEWEVERIENAPGCDGALIVRRV